MNPTNDPFALIRAAATSAPNYDLDTDAIIGCLTLWQSLCSFTVIGAEGDSVDIKFETFPADMDAFVKALYEFCPDLVDQGTGCIHEMIEMMEESGEGPTPAMQELVKGIDFSDENYGLEVLKRQLLQRKSVQLWWD